MDLFFRETGTGKTLVILHGLFGSSDNWMSIAKGLEDDYRLLIPDLRNHGQSGHDEIWDYDVMSDDLKGFVERYAEEKPIFLGHSMGGKLAMEFALYNPGMVEKLVVADIAPREYPVHHQTILEGLNSIDVARLQSRKEADQQLSTFVPEFGVRAFLLKNLLRDEDGSFSWKLNLPVIDSSIENVGRPVSGERVYQGPTLFIRGEKSNYVSDEDFENSKIFFPSAELATLSDAGHWLHSEKPKEFILRLKEFLEV